MDTAVRRQRGGRGSARKPITSTRLLVQKLVSWGAPALVADSAIRADVGAAAIVDGTLVQTWGRGTRGSEVQADHRSMTVNRNFLSLLLCVRTTPKACWVGTSILMENAKRIVGNIYMNTHPTPVQTQQATRGRILSSP